MTAKEVCLVLECNLSVSTRGWCIKHYTRWLRHGDPNYSTSHCDPIIGDEDARFNKYTNKEGPFRDSLGTNCWLWMGARNEKGYGRITVSGRSAAAHRWAYRRFIGEIPKGLEINHLCYIRACVNPDHLEVVTHLENLEKRSTIGGFALTNRLKTHCIRGHLLAGDNLKLVANGWRSCKICTNAAKKRYADKIRGLA